MAMYFTGVVLVAALVIGYARGGRFTRLGDLSLRRPWLVLVAAVPQGLGAVAGSPPSRWGLAVSLLAALALVTLNWAVPGMVLVALGLLSNGTAVLANGKMPVSAEASGRAGVSTQQLLAGTHPTYELAGSETRVRWITDVIPLPLPYKPLVISPGDVLIAAGLAELVVVGMGRRRAVARLAAPHEPTEQEDP